jgi:hypothetical protein
VRIEGNNYVVPHTLVGQQIILRVKNKTIRIFYNDCLVASYDIPEGKGRLVQDKRFYEALIKDREMNRRKYKSGRRINLYISDTDHAINRPLPNNAVSVMISGGYYIFLPAAILFEQRFGISRSLEQPADSELF